MESLPCATTVYRAMRRKDWANQANSTVLSAAFIRRPQDTEGLSVDISSAKSCARNLNKCHGVATLRVGHIRDLGLDVTPDVPPHANITGLPCPKENRTEAEHLATLLARHARLLPEESWTD